MIALGCDHGGYKLKEEIKKYLDETGIDYKDFGTNSEERTDCQIYAKKVSKNIQRKECNLGILICKTGNGMAITANKFKGIRCALCFDEYTAKQAKEHLNANIIAIPAESINISKAVVIIRNWLGSEFLGGKYEERLNILHEIESENMK